MVISMELEKIAEALFARAHQIPGMQGVVELRFSPDHAVSVTVMDRVTVGPAKPDPDVAITISPDDFTAIATGNLDLARLFTAGRIRVDGDFGLATLLPQVIQSSFGDDSADDSDTASNTDEQRRPAPARHADVVTASQPPLETIERFDRRDLSSEEFHRRYVLPCRPVIITNALQDWPLYNMSHEESIRHFEGLQGMVRTGDYVNKTFSRKREFRPEPIAQFIRSAKEYSDTNETDPPPYLGSNSLPESLESLIGWPEYFRRDQYIPPRIWIGPKGTVTPLHRDDSDNLFAQVWGEKLFIFAAPHERQRLSAWTTYRQGGLEGSEVNAESPDYQEYPEARQVRFVTTRVGPGDLLFIPDGWFHYVRSLSMSLSVNFWTTSVRHAEECA